MPDKQQHIAQAEHNRLFWNSFDLGATPFLDWVVCGIFYEAVHWVEAFLAAKGQHSTTHVNRQSTMERYRDDLEPMFRDFFILKNDSENARYGCWRPSLSDMQTDIPRLDAIKHHIRARFIDVNKHG